MKASAYWTFTKAEMEEAFNAGRGCDVTFEDWFKDEFLKNEEQANINFLYMDGIAGRQFYMKINSVRIDVGWRPEDAVARAKEILADLSIDFYGKIEFVSDGTLG